MDADYVFKIIVVGDPSVGKSSLVRQFHHGVFERTAKTIGVDYFLHEMNIEGKKVKLQLWDTAGEERFRAMSKIYYRDCHGALLVFDLSSLKSFENTQTHWIQEIQNVRGSDVFMTLVGNKCDLIDSKQVTGTQIQGFADLYCMNWIETSAKDATNVTALFESMVIQMIERHEQLRSYQSLESGPQSFGLHSMSPIEEKTYLNTCSCGYI